MISPAQVAGNMLLLCDVTYYSRWTPFLAAANLNSTLLHALAIVHQFLTLMFVQTVHLESLCSG